MLTIWKWELSINDKQTLQVPFGTRFIKVDRQGGGLCLWGEVNTGIGSLADVTILVRGTGNPWTGEEGKYLGSAIFDHFVWHVYEAK